MKMKEILKYSLRKKNNKQRKISELLFSITRRPEKDTTKEDKGL